eukprot:36846-Pelagomonas_calceolata.AAC.4
MLHSQVTPTLFRDDGKCRSFGQGRQVGAATEFDGVGLVARVGRVRQQLLHATPHRHHAYRVGVHLAKHRPV